MACPLSEVREAHRRSVHIQGTPVPSQQFSLTHDSSGCYRPIASGWLPRDHTVRRTCELAWRARPGDERSGLRLLLRPAPGGSPRRAGLRHAPRWQRAPPADRRRRIHDQSGRQHPSRTFGPVRLLGGAPLNLGGSSACTSASSRPASSRTSPSSSAIRYIGPEMLSGHTGTRCTGTSRTD